MSIGNICTIAHIYFLEFKLNWIFCLPSQICIRLLNFYSFQQVREKHLHGWLLFSFEKSTNHIFTEYKSSKFKLSSTLLHHTTGAPKQEKCKHRGAIPSHTISRQSLCWHFKANKNSQRWVMLCVIADDVVFRVCVWVCLLMCNSVCEQARLNLWHLCSILIQVLAIHTQSKNFIHWRNFIIPSFGFTIDKRVTHWKRIKSTKILACILFLTSSFALLFLLLMFRKKVNKQIKIILKM